MLWEKHYRHIYNLAYWKSYLLVETKVAIIHSSPFDCLQSVN